MKITRRFFLTGLVLLMPVLLSHCSTKQGTLPNRPLRAADNGSLGEKPVVPWPQLRGARLKALDDSQERLQNFGDLSLSFGDYHSSLMNYLEILNKNPDRTELRYRVGVILLLAGQFEEARKQLARVLLEQPDFLEAHEAMGLVHLQEKQYPQALQELNLVLSRDSQRARTHHLLGVTYLAAGQTRKAATALETAVKLDPGHLSSYLALTQAHMQQKNFPQAITWIKQGLSLDPKHQKLNYQLGMALAALNRYPEALEAFLQSGDEAQALNNIGVHYFLAGRYEEAAKCFQKAMDSRPQYYEEAKINLQRALEKLQQHASNTSD